MRAHMSRLTDLLSTIKQAEQKKEVTPGLSESISSSKRRDPWKRRIVFFTILVFVALALGLAAAYMADHIKRVKNANRAPDIQLTSSDDSSSLEATGDRIAVEKTAPVSSPTNRTASYGLKKSGGQMTIPAELAADEAPIKSASHRPASPVASQEKKIEAKDTPEEITGIFYKAREFELNGDLPKAVQTYMLVLEREPRNYRAMNNIASLYMRMERPKEALGYLEDSVRLKGDYVPALINMGILQANAGNAAESEVSLLKALSLDGSNRDVLFNIAVLYENTLRYDKAREYYRKLDLLGDTEGAKGLKRLADRP